MNCETGEMFNSMKDGMNEAMDRGLTEKEAMSEMMPIDEREYGHLKGMNRAQRRQWAKVNKKKKLKQQQVDSKHKGSLYPCPYDKACNCNMQVGCNGCEAWAKHFERLEKDVE